jgi:putative peptidoglycan lipid II flippase
VAILIYVLTLGWLQYRRFVGEAAAKGANLEGVPGMFDAALRMAMAAAIAIGAGLGARAVLLQFLPEITLWALLFRAAALCVVGIGVYVALARMLGVHELAEVESMLRRQLRRRTSAPTR